MTGHTAEPVRTRWARALAPAVAAVSAATLVACYDPTVVDCAVPCEAPGDCAAGQICGSDGFCSTPEVAGTCAEEAPGPLAGDGRALHLVVEGRGVVLTSVDGIECAGEQHHPGDCWFEVAEHADLTLVAASTHPHWDFDRWGVEACGGAPECALTIDGDVLVTARFVRR